MADMAIQNSLVTKMWLKRNTLNRLATSNVKVNYWHTCEHEWTMFGILIQAVI